MTTECKPPMFSETHCSQCGGTFGPGDNGYSHCGDHAGLSPDWKRDRRYAYDDKASGYARLKCQASDDNGVNELREDTIIIGHVADALRILGGIAP